MHTRSTSFAHLYLPLLTDLQPNVRRHACALLLATHGEHGLTLLRRLLSADDHEIRQQAGLALRYVAEHTDLPVHPQPFSGVHIQCLGRTRIFVGGDSVEIDAWVRREHGAVGWQKVQGVLAYLLHCGRRGTTRATLEAAIWGSAAPATIGRTLQALRRLIADLLGEEAAVQALTIADQFCLLSPEVYRSDVQAFEQTFNMASHTEESAGLAASAGLYAQAMRLYGGPYMIDIAQGAPWAMARRDHLRGSFLIAAERVAEHAYDQQRYHECADVCAQVFDADETADEIVAWLLRAYGRLGQSCAIEHAYRRYLRANALDEGSPDARQDAVVLAYQELRAGAAA
ncbi:MAG: bacterial transcriptional activator domain-containing protein [Chloroflexales bacterium]